MSPRRTRRGTIRVDTSVNESIKSSPKVTRRTRRINKSQQAKGTEEDDNTAEASVIVNNLTATGLLNDTTLNTRKRKKKGQDFSITQDCSVSLSVNDISVSIEKKNVKTPKVSKNTKKSKAKKVDDSLISADESFDKKIQKELSNSLISEDEEKPPSGKRVRLSDHRVSQKNVNKTPEKSGPSTKSSGGNVTPKNSPILNISFSPSRSKKTPRKSPVNLGSPKTHSRYSLKALNIPRKLEIEKSPSSSENSINFSLQENVSSTGKKKNSPLKVSPKFPKSPKIVLKTPKAESGKKSILKRLSTGIKKSIKNVFSAQSENTLESKTAKVENANKKEEEKKSLDESTSKSPNKSKNTSNKANVSFKLDQLSTADTSLKGDIKNQQNSSKTQSSEKTPGKSSKKSPTHKTKKSPKIIAPLSASKMPKIVLIEKSKKSLSKSRTSTPNKSSKTTAKSKTSTPTSVAKISPKSKKATPSKSVKISPKSKKATPGKSPKVSPKSNSASKKSPKKSQSGNVTLSPRVVVNKLPSPQLKSPSPKANLSGKVSSPQKNSASKVVPQRQPSIKLVPLDHGSQTWKNQRISVPGSKISPSKKPSIGSALSVRMNSLKSTNSPAPKTPSHVLDKRLSNLKPTKTSTPRERPKRPLTTPLDKKGSSPRKSNVTAPNNQTNKSRVIKKLNSQSVVEKSLGFLEDVSSPCLDESSLLHMSDVFETDNSRLNSTFEVKKRGSSTPKSKKSPNKSNSSDQGKKSSPSKQEKTLKDDTYELEQPKTPGLQNRSKKRTSHEAELETNEEKETKRTCRVTFASPGREKPVSSMNRVGTPGHAMQQKKTPASASKTPVGVRRRISSVSSALKTPVAPQNLRRSQSLSETQVASVNRLSRPKIAVNSDKKFVSGLKTPLPKKIPNFAGIHQKNFDKMVSIVDLKKRVENRRIAIKNAAPSSTKKVQDEKPAPPDATSYSRFGFKMRKSEAVNLVAKKQTGTAADTREKKRENARSALKGVRMNRRFELQMKARTKNS